MYCVVLTLLKSPQITTLSNIFHTNETLLVLHYNFVDQNSDTFRTSWDLNLFTYSPPQRSRTVLRYVSPYVDLGPLGRSYLDRLICNVFNQRKQSLLNNLKGRSEGDGEKEEGVWRNYTYHR